MKILSKNDFEQTAGLPLNHQRDFSLYDGAPFDCVCGSTHKFSQYSGRPFGSTGASAKFVVSCPDDPASLTIIKTKNKFMIMFDRFVSQAGYIDK